MHSKDKIPMHNLNPENTTESHGYCRGDPSRSPIGPNLREVAAWPHPRLTARVNPTLHDAQHRIEHAGDGGPSIVGLTLAVNLEGRVWATLKLVPMGDPLRSPSNLRSPWELESPTIYPARDA